MELLGVYVSPGYPARVPEEVYHPKNVFPLLVGVDGRVIEVVVELLVHLAVKVKSAFVEYNFPAA
jgi:hypothetical protein